MATSKEAWKAIPGFPGYEASSQGRIKSHKGLEPRILKQSVKSNGYLFVGLMRNGQRATRTVHVLVALSFIGDRPSGMHICHRDGNPANNTAVNLRYDTPKANAKDRIKHRGGSFLTKDIVNEMKHLKRQGHTLSQIAQKYSVTSSYICRILKGTRGPNDN